MRIYFAAAQGFDIFLDRSRFESDLNVFTSFYYEDGTIAFFRKRGKVDPTDTTRGYVTIDSGAHTFFGEHGIVAAAVYDKSHKVKTTSAEIELYLRRYISFLKHFYDYYDFFVELDLQEILGPQRILDWRARLKKEGLWAKCITCYHSGDSWQWYQDMVADSESRYVALQGLRTGEKNIDYPRLIKHAYDNQCRVHGFAFTGPKLLDKLPFFSVDSSTYSVPFRFGGFVTFERGGVWQVRGNENLKKNLGKNFHSAHLKRSMKAEDSEPILEHGIGEYLKFQRYLTDLWTKRGIVWKE